MDPGAGFALTRATGVAWLRGAQAECLDHYVFVDRSLQFWRLGTGVTAVALLLYGLIFEER